MSQPETLTERRCKKCGGVGKIEKHNISGALQWRICPACKGEGVINVSKEHRARPY